MFFSVVIPLYNKEISIKTTLESVLNQSFRSFEVVIVNDGSTDNSSKVVKEFSDSRIRLINQTNKGVSAARNRGIREARYDWIAFLDGDDLWKENHLEEMASMIRSFPDAKVFSTSFILSDGKRTHEWITDCDIFKVGNFFETSMKKSVINSSMSVVYKDCFNECGFFNENLTGWEDRDLWGRLARKFEVIKNTKETVLIRKEAENRSNLHFNIFKHGFYHYDFGSSTSSEETRYYKREMVIWLRNRLKEGKFRLFFILFWKQREHIKLWDLFKRSS